MNIDENVNPEEVRGFIEFLSSSLKDPIPKVKSTG